MKANPEQIRRVLAETVAEAVMETATLALPAVMAAALQRSKAAREQGTETRAGIPGALTLESEIFDPIARKWVRITRLTYTREYVIVNRRGRYDRCAFVWVRKAGAA